MQDDELETRDTERPPPMTERTPAADEQTSRPIASLTDEEVREELLRLLAPEELRVERRIVLYLARRFCVLGLRCYGPIALEDERDNFREAVAEAGDLLFYLAREALSRGE